MIKINIALGVISTLISILGLGWTLIELPTPPAAPGWIFIFLLTTGLAGLVWEIRNSRTPTLFLASITITIYWAVIQYSLANISSTVILIADFIAQNDLIVPYVKINLDTIITTIYACLALPLLMLLIVVNRAFRNFYKFNPDINNTNFTGSWILKLLDIKKSDDTEYLDTTLCIDSATKRPVTFKGKDRFLSLAMVGTTGTGKTSSILTPLIYQDLVRYKKGHKMAITVIEPTKDLTDKVALMCEKLEIPYVYIDPSNPNTKRFNILQGEMEIAAEATRSVLSSLFGNQQAFFSQVQQTMARNTVLLLKKLYGDNLDINDISRTLRDVELLETQVNRLKKKEGRTDLVQYFEFEPLGELREKYTQFAAGLRQQLEDIGGNALLKRVMSKPSDIDLDSHLQQGGVFIVNTAMGDLMKKLSEVFGQYILIHIIYAVFRKPPETWKIPHALYIDELPKYLGPDVGFEDLLAIGRKYGNMTTIAMQSISQLTHKLKSHDAANTILNTCRSKVVFGGMDHEDAKHFEKDFGVEEKQKKNATYENKVIMPVFWAKSYRTTNTLEARYSYTKLMELEEYQFIYRIVQNARLQPPRQGKGKLVDLEKIKPPSKPVLTRLKEMITTKNESELEDNELMENHPGTLLNTDKDIYQETIKPPEIYETVIKPPDIKKESQQQDNDNHNNQQENITTLEKQEDHKQSPTEELTITPKNSKLPKPQETGDGFWS